MRLLIITLLLPLIQLSSYGQLKKKKNKISKNEYEVFYTTKKQPDFKNGEYSYFKNKTLRKKGYYKNNKKDSVWVFYNTKGKEVQKGKYKNDNRTGLWKEIKYPNGITKYKYLIKKGIYNNSKKDSIWVSFKFYAEIQKEELYSKINYTNGVKNGNIAIYGKNSNIPKVVGKYRNDTMIGRWKIYNGRKVVQVYDFNNDSLINLDTAYVEKNKIVTNGKFKNLIYISEKAKAKQGLNNLLLFVAKNIRYPEDAKNQAISGRVYVSFQINSDGSLSDYKIEKGVGYGCDEEAIRVIKLTKQQWFPALFMDISVPTKQVIPVSFRYKTY